ncbi:PREDICTED: uncharacterized protein LOC105359864 [Ceratosolen solmsi marchali]|uniref:Uncharacterized protein LOC105359864 n=1 Tax=Ceratosolen solmsi marchali TaxID=326594 RepID=A0AAJ6VLQ7_9HYME|nr:PREDICTED: uncharacterized protein LOC105359864 [Ceratosolen solmsi marchali]
MHFWIDKPTGRCYGFNGRHYPTMSFSKVNFGQHRRCDLDVTRLQMLTPVHRFQAISNIGNSAGSSNHNLTRSIRFNTQTNEHRNNSIHNEIQLGQNISNTNTTGNNLHVPQSTSNSSSRGLLNFSELNDAVMAGYRLRCSVWIIFVLATGFVAAAKFYFDHQQGAGLEVLVFCGLLVILLLSGCFYSIICRRAQNNHHQEIEVEPIATVAVSNTISNDNIRQVSMPIRQNPPPPYHIAILIPPPISSDETPPPAYDKIVQ